MQATDANDMDEPIDPDDLARQAYLSAYERPIQLTAEEGVHARSMPRVRRFAGNEDRGPGTYTQPTEVEIVFFAGRENEHVDTVMSAELIDDVALAMIRGSVDHHEGRDPDPDRAL